MAEETETPKVEEVKADAPAEPTAEEKPAEEVKSTSRKNARAEKKMKDALLRHNLTQLPNVSSVMMRKGAQIAWSFTEPEVYYIENVYVVFGEPSVQDAGRRAVDDLKKTIPEDTAPVEPGPTVVEDAVEEDASDLKSEDIDTIIQQTGVTRARAIQALRDAGNDLVTAVMNLAL
jgi:nascent polypeptide-associated complex subunit alpha